MIFALQKGGEHQKLLRSSTTKTDYRDNIDTLANTKSEAEKFSAQPIMTSSHKMYYYFYLYLHCSENFSALLTTPGGGDAKSDKHTRGNM